MRWPFIIVTVACYEVPNAVNECLLDGIVQLLLDVHDFARQLTSAFPRNALRKPTCVPFHPRESTSGIMASQLYSVE